MNVLLMWSKNKGFRLALCLVVSAGCLYLAVRGMDFERTVQELKKSSPTPILGAVLFLFVAFWIRAYRWRYLLLPVKPISTGSLFRSTLIGFMGNYLLPFRAGEVMRAVSVGQNQNISKAAALGSILLERVFDGVVLSLTPFLFLAVLDLPRWILWVNLGLLMVYMTGLLMLVLAIPRKWIKGWLNPVTGLLLRFLGKRVGSIVGDFLQGIKGINRTEALLPVCLLSLLCWFFHGLYFFLLFAALDLDLSFGAALIIQMVIGLGVILPAAPGYIGNFEYFAVLGLALFGIAQEAAFAYALLAHVCQFIPVTVVGLYFALRNGFHPGVDAVSTQQVEVNV